MKIKTTLLLFVMTLGLQAQQGLDLNYSGVGQALPTNQSKKEKEDTEKSSTFDFQIINQYDSPTSNVLDITMANGILYIGSTYEIYKMDPITGAYLGSFDSPSSSMNGLTYGGGYLWAAEGPGSVGREIYKIDLATETVVETIEHSFGDYTHGMFYKDDLLYVNMFYLGTSDTTFVLDLQGNMVDKYPLPFNSSHGITYNDCYFWISSNVPFGRVYLIDPETFDDIDYFEAPGGTYPNGLHWDGEHLWIGNNGDNVIIQLEVDAPSGSNTSSTVNACNEYVTPSGDVLTQSGTYTYELVGSGGCDSIVNIDLTITAVDISVSIADGVLNAGQSGATYQWLDCDNNFAVIDEATNQMYEPATSGNYAVAITYEGCTDTSDCMSVSVSGTLESEFEHLIFAKPNPTSGSVIIELPQSFEEIQVKVKSIVGQTVYTKHFGTTDRLQLELEGARGVYIVELFTQNEKLGTLRVLKNK